jgi:hypothetical protein
MEVGLSLRATVFDPGLIGELVPILDRSNVDSVWFPSVGKAFDSLDMCGLSLGKTGRLRVGTGVIRAIDYEASRLIGRVHTLSEGSGRRFVLGVGTGPGIGGSAVRGLVSLSEKLRDGYPEKNAPPIFFAALRRGMLRAAYRHANGAILNFCSPDFVRGIVPKDIVHGPFTLACYLKLFFAEEGEVARKMLVEELRMYDRIPQYHAMFEEIGVASVIAGLDGKSSIPQQVSEISLANPTDEEVVSMLRRFNQAGVDLPIVYPYIYGENEYKTAVVRRLCALA